MEADGSGEPSVRYFRLCSSLRAGEKKQLATLCVMELVHVCLHPPQANSREGSDMDHILNLQ